MVSILTNILFISLYIYIYIYIYIYAFILATVSLNASNVPRVTVSNRVNVLKKNFYSLTFQWRGINSASGNASTVYLITLQTIDTRLNVEERVLGLVSELGFYFNVVL